MPYRVADESSYKKLGGRGSWGSGILEVNLDCWNLFYDETAKLLKVGDFIWRGQRYDWELKSKFDRTVKSTNREEKLKEHRESFERAIIGRRGSNPPQLNNEDDTWSLGQHYGLATPLLDWTKSPFVAAYFAFIEQSVSILQNVAIISQLNGTTDAKKRKSVLENAPLRFVYGLSKDIRRWGPGIPRGGRPTDYYIKFIEPLSDENPRLLSQRGLFTKPMSEKVDIEKIVRACYKRDNEKDKKRIIFVKIRIPEIEREECLRNLNTMNINHATLFPDLIGAAEYCNTGLEIENYF